MADRPVLPPGWSFESPEGQEWLCRANARGGLVFLMCADRRDMTSDAWSVFNEENPAWAEYLAEVDQLRTERDAALAERGQLLAGGKRFQHSKGGIYIVTGIAEHTETGEDFVVYIREADGKIYARPRAIFEDGRFVEVDQPVDIGDPRLAELSRDRDAAVAERDRLLAEINTPHTAEFLASVRIESVHQRERWGSEHDAGKAAPDWFWLLGYLLGKALEAWKRDDVAKLLHHIVTAAATLANWHAQVIGADSRMRPGIEPPEVVSKCLGNLGGKEPGHA